MARRYCAARRAGTVRHRSTDVTSIRTWCDGRHPGRRLHADACGTYGSVTSGARGVGDEHVVTFHGVRGSTPCHGDEIARYGGNTSCVSVDVPGEDPLLFDLGTGLRYFGQTCPTDEPFRGTCLLSHLHWDHIRACRSSRRCCTTAASSTIYAPSQDDGRTVARGARATRSARRCSRSDSTTFPGHDRRSTTPSDDAFRIGGVRRRCRRPIPHVGDDLRLPGHARAARASPTSATTSSRVDGCAASPTACSSCATASTC